MTAAATATATAAAVLLHLFATLVSPARSACASPATDIHLVVRAFKSVSGFDPYWFSAPNATTTSCPPPSVTDIRLPSRNLTGILSWNYLRNLTGLCSLDLSSNNLQGSVPAWLFSSPTLLELDLSQNKFGGTVGPRHGYVTYSSLRLLKLSRNRFTSPPDVSLFPNLTVLDLSHNELRVLPPGLSNSSAIQSLDISDCGIYSSVRPVSTLRRLNYLDLSKNKLFGRFPSDFPSGLGELGFLNVSYNNFTGVLDPTLLGKFGESAFTAAGITNGAASDVPSFRVVPAHHYPAAWNRTRNTRNQGKQTDAKRNGSRKKSLILGISLGSGVLAASSLACLACCAYRWRKTAKRRQRWAISKPCQASFKLEKSGPFSFETESGTSWVADVKEPTSAPVVMFEKPLLALTFKNLIAATSRFGKDSLLAEGRCGPVYRGVLPGDLHVTIKVLEGARGVDRDDAVAAMEGLAKLKHPNLLTISGYCIAGKEKLVLYDYMPNGDLHQFLHELPTGAPNVEDWTTDTWEHPTGISPATGNLNWVMRHRIAVGIARGLAYLHHAGSVHGHMTARNVLLTENFDPRIAGFGIRALGRKESCSDGADPEGDVYDYGALLIEILTGREGSTVGWVRRLVREGKSEEAIEARLMTGGESVAEMVACMRVGYLCTAESPGKRPTMQQVVGLLKDIRVD